MNVQNNGFIIAVLKVEIARFVDDHFPGFVECRVVDASGQERFIIDKVPLVTSEGLDADSVYPQPGTLPCQVVAKQQDDAGREVFTIDIEHPWHVETTTGETRFNVRADQLSNI
jgi:hypothetical protein